MSGTVIVSAADAGFFGLALDLVLSIRAVEPDQPIVLLDLGLTEDQRALLGGLVTRLVEPGWDIDGVGPEQAPGWFRAMTSRPFLPDYAPGFETILWIDSDAWVQSRASLAVLAAAARDHRLAIIEEDYDHLEPFAFHDASGRLVGFELSVATIQSQNAAAYAPLLGADQAMIMARLPTLNSGVFALQATAPGWRAWAEQLRGLVARGAGLNKLIEQLALSLAVRGGAIEAVTLPIEHNFVVTHQRPAWDPARRRLIVPHTGVEIGIVHLTDLKSVPALPLPIRGGGGDVTRPLRYLAGLGA